jgi:hypothetical protein
VTGRTGALTQLLEGQPVTQCELAEADGLRSIVRVIARIAAERKRAQRRARRWRCCRRFVRRTATATKCEMMLGAGP